MNLRRALLIVLLVYSSGAAAYNETLSFMRTSEGDTIATISGFRPLCGIEVRAPLDVSVAGSLIDITSNTLAGGGGCVPPPDYAGPPYAVSVNLGHLAPMVYTVRWMWEGWATPIMTVTLDPSKLPLPAATAFPVPLMSAGGLTCLAWLVVFTGMISLRTSRKRTAGRAGPHEDVLNVSDRSAALRWSIPADALAGASRTFSA